MDFSGEVATTSKSLKTLHFNFTYSTKSDGEKFWVTLANDDDLNKLENVSINGEGIWFEDDCEECVGPLVIMLAR